MKYMVSKSIIQVIGRIWQPAAGVCAQQVTVDPTEVKLYVTDEDGRVTRDSVERYVNTHLGDFSEIIDFFASIEHNGQTVEIPWGNEDSELVYNDAEMPYGEDE